MSYSEGYGTKSRLYRTWTNMRVRCRYPKDRYYYLYGGRGIRVCEEWDNSYPAFREWAIANGYNDSLTIDRIDSDGNYCPENCRWATQREQGLNRRTNKRFPFNGEMLTIGEISERIGVNAHTLSSRLYHGATMEKLISSEVQLHREPCKTDAERHQRRNEAAIASYYRNIDKCRERAREYQQKKRALRKLMKEGTA